VHPGTPETGSTPANATVTGWVYQPLCAGFDVGSAVTEGPVVSTLTTTLACALKPAVFVAEQVRVCPVVSPATMVAVQPDEGAMPDSGSETAHVTVTAPVYQPFAPAGPDSSGAIDGGVVSDAASCVTGLAAVAKMSGRSDTNALGTIQRFIQSPRLRADRCTTRYRARPTGLQSPGTSAFLPWSMHAFDGNPVPVPWVSARDHKAHASRYTQQHAPAPHAATLIEPISAAC
jgi:hypothetical protein